MAVWPARGHYIAAHPGHDRYIALAGLRRPPPPPETEPSTPSAPASRFTTEEPGKPDVGAVRLHVLEAGKVALPDGRLAISDAFINDHPLVVPDLARGEHSVEILVAQSQDDERIAAARVRLGTEAIASWRLVGVFAVDSGNGAFFDPAIAPQRMIQQFNERLLTALEASARPTYSIASIQWEGRTFVAFSTGFGDGRYPVFLGSSSVGAPMIVLVDSEILPWPN